MSRLERPPAKFAHAIHEFHELSEHFPPRFSASRVARTAVIAFLEFG